MPPPPEFLNGLGKVGRIEVFEQMNAQHFRSADGHIGVAREVAIDLQSIDHGGKHQENAGIAFVASVHRVYQHRRPVRDAELQEEAPDEGKKPPAQLGKVRPLGAFVLGQQLVPPADGAGQDLGKEGDEQRKPQEILFRLVFTLVDVDQVPGCLEGKEGDARGLQETEPGQGRA